MLQDRAAMIWIVVVFCLSSLTVWSGMTEVQSQRDAISRVLELDKQDRLAEFAKQGDWGAAAYYSFHFTYDSPSDFAFAAIGQRDTLPWKHRIRMLALEGQIYEQDAGNPELALIGRFDFAFLAAFIIPLVLIFLLHDLRARERAAGRYDLLVATAGGDRPLWWTRAFLRAGGIFVAAIIPLAIAGIANGTERLILIAAIFAMIIYAIFWTIVCLWFASWQQSGSVILTSLIGLWLMLSTIMPAGGRMLIDRAIPIPSGAEILMTQREKVNDAWDLPKEATMLPFLERHPEWSVTSEITIPFEWKWYYAFQQVGDQATEELSSAYLTGRVERDRIAGLFSILTPPAFFERLFQRLAETDVSAALVYENKVRDFHAQLRSFYYPGLFGDQPFDISEIDHLPMFGEGNR